MLKYRQVDFAPHILSRFDSRLKVLRETISDMGLLVAGRFNTVVAAIASRDSESVRALVDSDHEVNAYDCKVGERCADILARHHPMARDLRLVVAALRIAIDLERVGDETEKIARQIAVKSFHSFGEDIFADIVELAECVESELNSAMNCFISNDCDVLEGLFRADRRADILSQQIVDDFVDKVSVDERRGAMSGVICARSLERIGDHAKNVAEHVVYSVKGIDVRSQVAGPKG